MPNPAYVSGQSLVIGVATSVASTNTSSAIAAGLFLIVPVATYCDTVVPGVGTVTDNQSNVYTHLFGQANSATDRCRIDWFATGPTSSAYASSALTVTAHGNASNGANNEMGLQIQAYSGFGSGVAVDVTGGATFGSSTASGTVTLAAPTSQQAVELVLAGIHFNDSTNPDGLATPTGTGTWVSDSTSTNGASLLALQFSHQVTSATGTAYSATWSGLDTSTNFGGSMGIIALYPAPAAVSSGPNPRTIFIMP